MSPREAIETLPQLVDRVNEALKAIGHPAEVMCLVSSDKSDPLNQKIIIALKAGMNLDTIKFYGR